MNHTLSSFTNIIIAIRLFFYLDLNSGQSELSEFFNFNHYIKTSTTVCLQSKLVNKNWSTYIVVIYLFFKFATRLWPVNL